MILGGGQSLEALGRRRRRARRPTRRTSPHGCPPGQQEPSVLPSLPAERHIHPILVELGYLYNHFVLFETFIVAKVERDGDDSTVMFFRMLQVVCDATPTTPNLLARKWRC